MQRADHVPHYPQPRTRFLVFRLPQKANTKSLFVVGFFSLAEQHLYLEEGIARGLISCCFLPRTQLSRPVGLLAFSIYVIVEMCFAPKFLFSPLKHFFFTAVALSEAWAWFTFLRADEFLQIFLKSEKPFLFWMPKFQHMQTLLKCYAVMVFHGVFRMLAVTPYSNIKQTNKQKHISGICAGKVELSPGVHVFVPQGTIFTPSQKWKGSQWVFCDRPSEIWALA